MSRKKKKKSGGEPKFRVGPSGLEARSSKAGWVSLTPLWSDTGDVSEDALRLTRGVRPKVDESWERKLSDFDDEDIP